MRKEWCESHECPAYWPEKVSGLWPGEQRHRRRPVELPLLGRQRERKPFPFAGRAADRGQLPTGKPHTVQSASLWPSAECWRNEWVKAPKRTTREAQEEQCLGLTHRAGDGAYCQRLPVHSVFRREREKNKPIHRVSPRAPRVFRL